MSAFLEINNTDMSFFNRDGADRRLTKTSGATKVVKSVTDTVPSSLSHFMWILPYTV